MEITKFTDKIEIEDKVFWERNFGIGYKLKKAKAILDVAYDKLCEEILANIDIDKIHQIKIANKKVYYDVKRKLFVPDYERYTPQTVDTERKLTTDGYNCSFEGFSGKLPDSTVALWLCGATNTNICYARASSKELYYINARDKKAYKTGDFRSENVSSGSFIFSYTNNLNRQADYACILPIFEPESDLSLIEIFIKYDAIPDGLNSNAKKLFICISALYSDEIIKISGNKAVFTKKGKEYICGDDINDFLGQPIAFKQLKDKSSLEPILKKYTECD
ncbi:MAG: hypothetical protein IJ736_06900, partial [Firmicutes bacterium]|nr:hypothetical protein [Bacillota bacterium]